MSIFVDVSPHICHYHLMHSLLNHSSRPHGLTASRHGLRVLNARGFDLTGNGDTIRRLKDQRQGPHGPLNPGTKHYLQPVDPAGFFVLKNKPAPFPRHGPAFYPFLHSIRLKSKHLHPHENNIIPNWLYYPHLGLGPGKPPAQPLESSHAGNARGRD